ncbi:MAG TPA: class I SAM-dependent methyltransferase [Vicinamibacteria bacterium]|nr:class I SAM-dependent methyltransferase [Vicinamibacteria bacterium]
MSSYGEDLAYIQHQGFADFSESASPGLLRLMARAGIRHGVAVDLGCGSGQWLRELDRAGFRTVGVESSRSLARIARKIAPRTRLKVGSVYEVDVPSCDVITALGEVLCYLPARPIAPWFRRVSRALRPGGLFVFDVLVAGARPMRYRTWRSGPGWAVLVSVSEKGRRVTREITTFRRAGEGYRRAYERHVLRVLSRDRLCDALRSAGFSVRVSRRYGELELPPRRLAFVARKC